MNKLFGLAAVGGLLLVQASASQALNVVIGVPDSIPSGTSDPAAFAAEGAAYPGSDMIQGINSTANADFKTTLAPGVNNLTLDGTDNFSSGFSYGFTPVVPGPTYPIGVPNAPASGTYPNSPANFSFTLQEDGGPVYEFVMNGRLNDGAFPPGTGTMTGSNNAAGGFGNYSSHTAWEANDGPAGGSTTLFLYSIGGVPVGGTGVFVTTTAALNPVGGQASNLYSFIYDPGGLNQFTMLYVDNVDLINPMFQPPSAIRGFISTVPEPSSLALLFGSGLTGSLLLRRRRRA